MMYEVQTVCVYKGSRTYKTKDGRDGVIHKFLDGKAREFEIMVLEPIPEEVKVDSHVLCTFLFGDKYNKEQNCYEKKRYFKNVAPATAKK